MAVVLIIGLAYMVVYYLTSSGTDPHIPVMDGLNAWNFAVGFGVMLVGLVMAVRWR
jgi:hydrogenase-4 membrane subunit HyfE